MNNKEAMAAVDTSEAASERDARNSAMDTIVTADLKRAGILKGPIDKLGREFVPHPVAVEPPGDQPVRHEGSDPGFSPANAPYIDLFRIVRLAYDQASVGKGRERHAAGPVGIRTWDKQPIMEIGRMVGPGYASGQVMKKVQEAVTMAGNGNFQGAKAEALGAIVYAAAMYKLLEEIEAAHAPI